METGKTSKTHSDVKGRDKDNGSEESENVAIACYSNNKKYGKSVFIFTVPRWRKKKGTREPFSYQSQRAENSILYALFKKEGLFLLEELLMSGDLMCKIDLLCSSIRERLSNVCKISVERQSIQISMFLFRSLFSAKNIHKTH